MTTPKKPNYMFPELQGLPDEFRRLAAEAQEARNERDSDEFAFWDGKRETWTQAAQMLEERLNGSA
jgi:sirohydrochlorin ferrochelatase